MPERVVFEGVSKKGRKILIRYPTREDAKAMCSYINTLSKEQTFIRLQGELISFQEETVYLNKQLEKIQKQQGIQLLVFCNRQLIGISEINMKDKVERHEGVFGISIAKVYRGEGIGKKLMEAVLAEAEKNIPQLKIVTLGIFEDNPLAKQIYEKFGFKEYGRLPHGILHKGNYVDHIYLYKNVGK